MDAARRREVSRPSSLPMLAECPQFEGRGSDFADTGTARHKALAALMHGDDSLAANLDEEDREGVEWAEEYIRLRAPMSDYPLLVERHVNPLDADFNPLFPNGGTLDFSCGPELFDFKWRRRNYREQMAAYALGMMQETGWPQVNVHVLFGNDKYAQRYSFCEAEAEEIVTKVLAKRLSDPEPHPCDYCGWCSKAATCPALLTLANHVADGREDWQLEKFHSSEINDPAEMGKALRMARKLADWCEAIEHHAKEMAIKQGALPAGFKLQDRKGNRFIASVSEAFARLAMPQDEFLKGCEAKFAKLTEVHAGLHGLKKAQAEREIERKLGDALQRKPSTISLVADKTKE
jgi:hypothetical protein